MFVNHLFCSPSSLLHCCECAQVLLLCLTVFVTVNGQCSALNCQTCSSDGRSCDVCQVTYYSVVGDDGTIISCHAQCPSGYYPHDMVCYSCGEGCEYCERANDCMACESGKYVAGGKCLPCNASCASCQTIDKCESCKNTNEFLNSDGKCERCNAKCATCIDAADKCTSCPSYYQPLYDNEESTMLEDCVEICDDGTYYKNGACYRCDDSCKTCTSSDRCDTCKNTNVFLNASGKCEACEAKCAACYGKAGECLTCASNYQPLYDSEESTMLQDCVEFCDDRQYSKDGACYRCDDSCKTCTSSDRCDTCKNTNVFLNASGKCEACEAKCATCKDSADKCETCASGYNKYTNETTGSFDCVVNCTDGYYAKNGVCEVFNGSKQVIVVSFDDEMNVTPEVIKDALTGIITLPDDEHLWIEVNPQDDGSFVISVIQTNTDGTDVGNVLTDCMNHNP